VDVKLDKLRHLLNRCYPQVPRLGSEYPTGYPTDVGAYTYRLRCPLAQSIRALILHHRSGIHSL
jgi:hypothetical protein